MEIRKLLVANRGEIAVRVFGSCRRLGIGTIAVFAPDDEDAFHTRQADATIPIGSYLDPAELIRAAREAGADAIHPGYGFLAENGDFAEAVGAAGIVFVGPSPNAIRASGDKLEAKRLAREAGVPVLESGDPSEIGYPLIVKAAAGGGGRGMRVVRSPEELEEALESASREAEAGFGDGRVFAERYVERPRHVEIQLLADRHGTAIHLGERECSIQRRHQKVLEESPSPALDPELRAALGDAAVAFARAVGYENAGTAEFMLEGDRFTFLELNARLQVEHPVTELVTGVDLVEQQLRIAAGEPLSVESRDPEGHAVEVRLYAEHPLTFLPQAGRLERLELPDTVRVDAGVEAGDEIPVAYDPLIAKLSAHAATREDAFDDLSRALRATRVSGATTNLGFLRWLVDHPAVRAGETTTAFLGGESAALPAGAGLRLLVRVLAPEPRPGGASARSTPGADCRERRARVRRCARDQRARGADAGRRRPRARGRGRPRRAAPAASRARGDEDGDAARLALRGGREARARGRGRPGLRRRPPGGAGGLMDAADLLPDPLAQFARWLDEARAGGLDLPEAMTLATADAQGRPSARSVLLKGVDADGFRFFTNTESRKGRELAENPSAALVFYWPLEPRRQVTVAGTVAPLSREETEAYYRTRPLGSRLGAWASRQSTVVPDRDSLDRAFAEAEATHGDDPPLPSWWGGYLLTPTRLEFWQNRPNRLHDRFRYTRGPGGGWVLERLAP